MARVLVVDDNAEERRMYATMLYYNGFDVLEAEDAIAGLELARDEQPDLILMDYRLPRLDGLLAAEILQAIPETSAIPVLCLTGFNVDGDRARASGCRAVLAKPTRPHELINAVRRWLDDRPDQVDGSPRS